MLASQPTPQFFLTVTDTRQNQTREWQAELKGKKHNFDLVGSQETCRPSNETELPDGTDLPDENGQRGEACLQSVWGSLFFPSHMKKLTLLGNVSP